jgi:hypothetical protein
MILELLGIHLINLQDIFAGCVFALPILRLNAAAAHGMPYNDQDNRLRCASGKTAAV